MTDRKWWGRWWVILLIALTSAIPLMWPSTPPLVDVPGHIGRFRVELDLGSSQNLQRFFEFHWKVIGNLGTDLLIVPLSPFLGLEPSVKLIVLAIPVLTTLGLFWVAREVHGEVPPTALFAVPLIYGYPFNYGFINFALSMALALLMFALWLRLSAEKKTRVRSSLFVPLSCILWLVHAFGWGTLGLLAWSAELVRLHDKKRGWCRAGLQALLACLPLAIPLVLMVVWRSGDVSGSTAGFFDLPSKAFSIFATLRDRWLLWDCVSIAAILILVCSAVFDRHLELSRRLAIPAAVLAIIFILMPSAVFGSAYADMRLAPFMFMTAILAIRPNAQFPNTSEERLALLAAAFVTLRLAGNAVSFIWADNQADKYLAALQFIPQGARVLSLVGDSCGETWEMPRHSHLGSFVIARKRGFSNDQWQIAGGQLLRINYPQAKPFTADPSEVTISHECHAKILANLAKSKGLRHEDLLRLEDVLHQKDLMKRTSDEALAQFPREGFDYVWMIRPEGLTKLPRDLATVWADSDSMLLKVVRDPS